MKSIVTLFFTLLLFLCSFAQKWSWSEHNLSYARSALCAAALDDVVFFSGGMIENSTTFINIVDAYDISTNQWEVYPLTTPGRGFSAALAAGDKVFIAGGDNWSGGLSFSDVDIFSKETGTWTWDYLSEARSDIDAVALENLVFFAGGYNWTNSTYIDVIDIYNIETEEWSEEFLLEPKFGMGVAATTGKVFFAGGSYSTNQTSFLVEIYDINTEEWSYEDLQEARAFIGAVAYDNKVYFAGGMLYDTVTSSIIEIYNVGNAEWEDPIYLPHSQTVNVENLHNALVFAGEFKYIDLQGSNGPPSGKVDIYYPETGEWDTVADLNTVRRLYGYTAYKNRAFYAGGHNNFIPSNVVNVLHYDTLWTSLSNEKIQDIRYQLYPNPFSSEFTLDYTLSEPDKIKISLINSISGTKKEITEEYQAAGNHQKRIDVSNLPFGIYLCVLETSDWFRTIKTVKILKP